MNLIFNKGEKLYFKQNPAEIIEKLTNIKLYDYQKQILNNYSELPPLVEVVASKEA